MRGGRYSRSEDKLCAAIHAVALLLAVAGLVALIDRARAVGANGSLAAVIAYGTSMILVFLFSTLHHGVEPSHRLKRPMLALDHGSIFLLIAGTYTPFYLLLPPDRMGLLLGAVWGLAAAGLVLQMAAFLSRRTTFYHRIHVAVFMLLGWLPLLAIWPAVPAGLAPAGLALLVAGGIIYSVGAVFYVRRVVPFSHAVWHSFVVAGCALHFLSIRFYVLPAVA